MHFLGKALTATQQSLDERQPSPWGQDRTFTMAEEHLAPTPQFVSQSHRRQLWKSQPQQGDHDHEPW